MWSTEPPADEPSAKHPYVVTLNDKRFLRALRIAVDEDDLRPADEGPEEDGA